MKVCCFFIACVLSWFSCVWLFATLWNVAARLLCPWNSPGKNTGVGSHSLLQGIFPTQGLNLGFLHWQVDSLPSEPPGKPTIYHLNTFNFYWFFSWQVRGEKIQFSSFQWRSKEIMSIKSLWKMNHCKSVFTIIRILPKASLLKPQSCRQQNATRDFTESYPDSSFSAWLTEMSSFKEFLP